MHVRVEGKGPVVVLLHGAFASLHTWNDWTSQLKKKYKVVRIDLPGFGLTGPNIKNDYSISSHVHYLKGVLDQLKIKKAHLVGSSLGGWIAWEFALTYPKVAQRLGLIGSAGFLSRRNVPEPFKLAVIPFAGAMVQYIVTKERVQHFVSQVFSDQSKIKPAMLDRYYDLFACDGNPEAFVHLVNQRFKDNTSHLKDIKNKTLVMWGEDDQWLPLNNAHRFVINMPQAELVTYEGVGHIPMEEIPRKSCKDMMRFLASA